MSARLCPRASITRANVMESFILRKMYIYDSRCIKTFTNVMPVKYSLIQKRHSSNKSIYYALLIRVGSLYHRIRMWDITKRKTWYFTLHVLRGETYHTRLRNISFTRRNRSSAQSQEGIFYNTEQSRISSPRPQPLKSTNMHHKFYSLNDEVNKIKEEYLDKEKDIFIRGGKVNSMIPLILNDFSDSIDSIDFIASIDSTFY